MLSQIGGPKNKWEVSQCSAASSQARDERAKREISSTQWSLVAYLNLGLLFFFPQKATYAQRLGIIS